MDLETNGVGSVQNDNSLLLADSRGSEASYRAKTQFFAPERYTAVFLYTDSLNSAGYVTTV